MVYYGHFQWPGTGSGAGPAGKRRVGGGYIPTAAAGDAFNATAPANAVAYALDVTKPEQINEVAQQVIDRFGRIDVLVNNAGMGFAGAIEETSMQEARAVFETNFFGPLQLTQAFCPTFGSSAVGISCNYRLTVA